ncbi:hypothetical protein ACF087_35190 [Streptomyces goshikiensis]|uniref:hypothetical protein n=1 Tax=Streptomyces goshikiensis TaxID=1942 RepID=UPI0036FE4D13
MTTTDDTGRDWLETLLAGEWDDDAPQAAAPAEPEPEPDPAPGREDTREARARKRAEYLDRASEKAREAREARAEDYAQAQARMDAEVRRRAEADAAPAGPDDESEAEPEAGPDDEQDDAAGDEPDGEPDDEPEAGQRRWWSLKPAPAAAPAGTGGPAAASPTAPAPAVVPVPASGVARRVAASRWGWLAYHGSAAAVGHSALVAATGDHLGGAVWLGAAMVSVVPVTTAAVACCAGWVGWRLGRVLRPYLPFGALASPAGLIAGLAWGQGTAGPVADIYAWAAPWPMLAAPLALTALAGSGAWALLDHRVRHLSRPVRWAAHIPLATVALSAALYAPGALL